ncbi:MAG: hypothetical protein KF874_07985 [Rhizobiaceae bacterium]|nr:hypothetical protein [Rhizobiaceae bacterium]
MFKTKKIAGSLLTFALVGVCLIGASSYLARKTPAVEDLFPRPDSVVAPVARIQVTFAEKILPERTTIHLQLANGNGTNITNGNAIQYSDDLKRMTLSSDTLLADGEYRAKVISGDDIFADWEFKVSSPRKARETETQSHILIVADDRSPFSRYYQEILLAEGINTFSVIEKSRFSQAKIDDFQTIILPGNLDKAEVDRLDDWVEQGGNLVAIQPQGAMAKLAGVVAEAPRPADGYLVIDTNRAPGAGLTAEPIQFHGSASDFIPLDGTRVLASLTENGAVQKQPALTIRAIGSKGGQVAAFAFNLAKSVVHTRQGNPKWAGQDRDGLSPIRSNDLFYGNSASDPQPDFLDLNKVHIPQADETMRLLSNLLVYLQRDSAPLPRFWYFPKNYKAVFVMAADDHGTKTGTSDFFTRLKNLDSPGCDMAKWECPRATSWTFIRPWSFTAAGLTNEAAVRFSNQGFDVGVHVTTFCRNWSNTSLDRAFSRDLSEFGTRYPGLPKQQGNRLHCIAWSDYVGQAIVERKWGVRFDMNYYYWPRDWLNGRSGFMTGSGLPMRFSSANGQLIDVYQQETHLVDEVFFDNPQAIEDLIRRAKGREGYYGAFGTHVDFHNQFADLIIDIAQRNDVPMISGQQMLEWQDARANSSFTDLVWSNDTLEFTLQESPQAKGSLTGMLAMKSNGHVLSRLSRNGEDINFTTETIKGVEYALFQGEGGRYTADYLPAPTALTNSPADDTPHLQ